MREARSISTSVSIAAYFNQCKVNSTQRQRRCRDGCDVAKDEQDEGTIQKDRTYPGVSGSRDRRCYLGARCILATRWKAPFRKIWASKKIPAKQFDERNPSESRNMTDKEMERKILNHRAPCCGIDSYIQYTRPCAPYKSALGCLLFLTDCFVEERQV